MVSLSRIIKELSVAIQSIKLRFSQSYNVNPGDIIRADKTAKMNGHRLIEVVRAGGGADDIKELSTTSISMKEIFSSWDRISCDPNGQNANTDEQVLARGSYFYDDKNKAIICSRNSDAFSAFLSAETYPQTYTLKYMMDNRIAPGKGGDDDALIYVLAYMVDSKGVFHTINVIRVANEQNEVDKINIKDFDHAGQLALCYDTYYVIDNANNGSLLLASKKIDDNKYSWYNNYTYVNVDRKGTTINLESEYPNQELDGKFTLSWTLPSSKPSSWTQEQYDNIKYMLTHDTKIGFGTQSNISAFKVVSQTNLFDQITVYDLSENTKKIYKNGTVIKSESLENSILPNTMIYSTINDKFFYYRGSGSYIELLSRNKIEKQISDIQNAVSKLENKIDPNI